MVEGAFLHQTPPTSTGKNINRIESHASPISHAAHSAFAPGTVTWAYLVGEIDVICKEDRTRRRDGSREGSNEGKETEDRQGFIKPTYKEFLTLEATYYYFIFYFIIIFYFSLLLFIIIIFIYPTVGISEAAFCDSFFRSLAIAMK